MIKIAGFSGSPQASVFRRKLRSNARRLSVAASRVNPPSLRLAPVPSSTVPRLRLVAISCVPVRVRAACLWVLLTKVENILGRFHPRSGGPCEMATWSHAGRLNWWVKERQQRLAARPRNHTTSGHSGHARRRPSRSAEPLKTSTHHNAGEVFRRAPVGQLSAC
jgi:hypothetical protein